MGELVSKTIHYTECNSSLASSSAGYNLTGMPSSRCIDITSSALLAIAAASSCSTAVPSCCGDAEPSADPADDALRMRANKPAQLAVMSLAWSATGHDHRFFHYSLQAKI